MTDTRTCNGCGRCLPVTKFHVRKDRKTLQYYSRCIDCKRVMNRQRDLMRRPPQATRVWKSDAVKENNAFNLWHGPVLRERPLRWCA